jgi:hypothetical protein
MEQTRTLEEWAYIIKELERVLAKVNLQIEEKAKEGPFTEGKGEE